jgi:tripartite-type tricarboxylate transporter receptor subunit TctC
VSRFARFPAVCCFTCALFNGAAAGQAYPVKPIRFIVPFTPGGGTDLIARVIGQKLSEAFAQPVIVDNRPGAGSTIGTALVAMAPPDGYTLLMSSISIAFDTTLYKNLSYDPSRDLAPVSLVATQPNVVVVNPSLPVRSINLLHLQRRSLRRSITHRLE